MLPRLRQRLIIGLVLVIGGLCGLYARGALTVAQGSTGLSLIDSQIGTPTAIIVLLIAGLPAMLGALLCSARGNPLAGAFCIGAALLVLAAVGGSADGFFQRAQLPQDFTRLAVEAGIWFALLAVLLIVIDALRPGVRHRFGKFASTEHLGENTRLKLPDFNAILAGLVTAGLGAFFCNLLIQSSDGGQVNCSLILGFFAAAFVGHMIVSQPNPLIILLSPLIVAAGAYLWVAYTYHTTDAVLVHLYRNDLLNLAMGLPIQYASAGLAGCAMGVGMAQSMEYVRQNTTITAN